MTKRMAWTLAAIAALGVSSNASSKSASLRCTLTGKLIASCCCTSGQHGNLHCTLANKDVKNCCCESAK